MFIPALFRPVDGAVGVKSRKQPLVRTESLALERCQMNSAVIHSCVNTVFLGDWWTNKVFQSGGQGSNPGRVAVGPHQKQPSSVITSHGRASSSE